MVGFEYRLITENNTAGRIESRGPSFQMKKLAEKQKSRNERAGPEIRAPDQRKEGSEEMAAAAVGSGSETSPLDNPPGGDESEAAVVMMPSFVEPEGVRASQRGLSNARLQLCCVGEAGAEIQGSGYFQRG